MNDWHLDKRINVTHLLTTLSFIFALVVWEFNQDVEIKILKAHVNNLDQEAKEWKTDVRHQLRDLNMKMDDIIKHLITHNGNSH